jgi:Cu2+-containing amine oxidase
LCRFILFLLHVKESLLSSYQVENIKCKLVLIDNLNMSMEQIATSLPFVGGKKTTPQHPLGPLTANEIKESAGLIKGLWPSNTSIQFKSITLQEPNKAELLPFLEAEHAGQQTPAIERRSFVVYYIRNTVSYQKPYWLGERLVELVLEPGRIKVWQKWDGG